MPTTTTGKSDMVEGIRNGLTDRNNLLVVNCDFEQYMWDDRAAGCLAGQLTSFIQSRNIDRLIVITHSNGGNVMRWILSNPTWDARYPAIIQHIVKVDAIAPSSAGTPLADAVIAGNVFETSLGWLLGYKNDAVRQQQLGWMATYNQQYLLGTSGRPALPVAFRDVVGTDVVSGFWSSQAYCGGYSQSVGLEITQNWLSSCSDGFIECCSAQAAGTLWFRDTQRTSAARCSTTTRAVARASGCPRFSPTTSGDDHHEAKDACRAPCSPSARRPRAFAATHALLPAPAGDMVPSTCTPAWRLAAA